MQADRNVLKGMRQSVPGVKRRLPLPIQKAAVMLLGGVTKWLGRSEIWEMLVAPLTGELS